MELAASERLFMASAVMDTAPAMVPMIIFPINRSMLAAMPTIPDSRPMAARRSDFLFIKMDTLKHTRFEEFL